MNISMAPEFEQFVDAKVNSGDYSSASEVIRAGLRLLKERDAEHHAHRMDVQTARRHDAARAIERAFGGRSTRRACRAAV